DTQPDVLGGPDRRRHGDLPHAGLPVRLLRHSRRAAPRGAGPRRAHRSVAGGRGVSAAVRELGNGVYQLPTDYPEVCNATLWNYLVADGARFVLIDPAITSTLAAKLPEAIPAAGFGK